MVSASLPNNTWQDKICTFPPAPRPIRPRVSEERGRETAPAVLGRDTWKGGERHRKTPPAGRHVYLAAGRQAVGMVAVS